MSKQDDILNRLKSKKTAASTFLDQMNENAAANNSSSITSRQDNNKDNTSNNINVNDNFNANEALESSAGSESSDFLDELIKGTKKKDDQVVLTGIYLQKDLAQILDKLGKKGGRGAKSRIVNDALRKVFTEKGLL